MNYVQKQGYERHFDAFQNFTTTTNPYEFDNTKKNGGNRAATLFFYLSASPDLEGGQTGFPSVTFDLVEREVLLNNASLFSRDDEYPTKKVNDLFGPASWERQLLPYCYSRLNIKPRVGDAVLFYSLDGNGALDMRSIHAGCPVIQGTKFGGRNVYCFFCFLTTT